MTKEEIEKEAEEYAIGVFPNDEFKQSAVIQGIIKFTEPREKRIEELEEENNKLLDVINNQDIKIADLEKQLEQVKVLLNAEREVNEKKEYLQYTEYLMAQLEVAKDLIHQFLIQNPISDWLPKKAEQFLKEGEECRLQNQLMKNTKN